MTTGEAWVPVVEVRLAIVAREALLGGEDIARSELGVPSQGRGASDPAGHHLHSGRSELVDPAGHHLQGRGRRCPRIDRGSHAAAALSEGEHHLLLSP